jgi:hypothetical protein
MRKTRRGRRISAARAARLLAEMFQLGAVLDTAMRLPLKRTQLRPNDEIPRMDRISEPY